MRALFTDAYMSRSASVSWYKTQTMYNLNNNLQEQN